MKFASTFSWSANIAPTPNISKCPPLPHKNPLNKYMDHHLYPGSTYAQRDARWEAFEKMWALLYKLDLH